MARMGPAKYICRFLPKKRCLICCSDGPANAGLLVFRLRAWEAGVTLYLKLQEYKGVMAA